MNRRPQSPVKICFAARLRSSLFEFSFRPPARRRLGVVRRPVLLRYNFGLLFCKHVIEARYHPIRRPALLPAILDIRDGCLGAIHGQRNFYLRHAEALQFEDDVLRFHEHRL